MLPRYRKPPLRPIGRRAARVAKVRRNAYAAVDERCTDEEGVKRCELCHWPPHLGWHHHHVWHRTGPAGIPSEVCELKESILGVCRSCHSAIHSGDEKLARRAEWTCVLRFGRLHGLDLLSLVGPAAEPVDPLEAMRRLVREWEAGKG